MANPNWRACRRPIPADEAARDAVEHHERMFDLWDTGRCGDAALEEDF